MKRILVIFSDAMNDADRVLVTMNDPRNSKALTIKGDALYNLGDFEHSLLSYHRAFNHINTKVDFLPQCFTTQVVNQTYLSWPAWFSM